MENLTINAENLLVGVLDSLMRGQFGTRISGISHNNRRLIVHFFEPFNITDEVAAQAIIDAHDPVFIYASRVGNDITITVSKPRNVDSATELTLTVDDTPLPEASALTANVAVVQIESADEITIGIVDDYPHQEVTI